MGMKLAGACALLLALVLANAARAQNVAAIYVGAPQVRVTSGDAVQVTAVLRDAAGNVVTSAAVAWTSNNAAVAKVDASGNVQTAALGFADITAAAGGRQ